MKNLTALKQPLLVSAWFMFLTFPLMVIRVNTIENVVEWRWRNMIWVGTASFLLTFLWRYLSDRREAARKEAERTEDHEQTLGRFLAGRPEVGRYLSVGAMILALIFPFVFSTYQTNIMATALMYAVLGLGLNIVVGQAGLLNLGYVAFYAAGAYSYALLNHHFGIGFWTALPVGAVVGALFGILLGFPVLRLRGDYLAIVTLGFGEITRLVLENWNDFSFGPSGISNIPRPGFFGIALDIRGATIYLYFLVLLLCLATVFIVNRLQNSRIGRAWIAIREDETASQAMGIDGTKTKLTAFALGAFWAGMVGVIFAAKTTFINPASFTFLESAMILSIVVLGGIGSIPGIITAALFLILVPEYLRAFSNYRMLIFGSVMVLMMLFRPQGIVAGARRTYTFRRRKSGPELERG
ncbi:MAG: branched-chain amino acid ABC transporter permease [Deltaproteobacteria bacterium]|nr:branched-chain amino acid ABC transporter permease [Deltaproteobacteria bacterium]